MSIIRYEQGSLYDIILRHRRIRLLVSPPRWTDLHSQLLRIHFIEQPAIVKPVPPATKGLRPSRKAEILSKDLDTLASPPGQASENSAIKHIISTFFSSLSHLKTGTGLNLCFGKEVRKAVQIPCLWSYGTGYTPILAYVSRSQLAALRKNLLLKNAYRDPYIIAVLLAMAQAHFYNAPVSRPPSNSGQQFNPTPAPFHDITLQVITHDGHGHSAKFVVYNTVVTATFLTRFMVPHRGPNSRDDSTGMNISYTPVPVWPLLGLKERLARALGPGITGPVHDDAGYIGFWEPLVAPRAARKRRCPDDRTVPSAAKKRRTVRNHVVVAKRSCSGDSGQNEMLGDNDVQFNS